MKITREISVTLNMDVKKDTFIVYDLTTLGILMGSNSCAQNPFLYKIVKAKYKGRPAWLVPKESVKNRIEKMEKDIDTWDNRLVTMKSIMKQGGK